MFCTFIYFSHNLAVCYRSIPLNCLWPCHKNGIRINKTYVNGKLLFMWRLLNLAFNSWKVMLEFLCDLAVKSCLNATSWLREQNCAVWQIRKLIIWLYTCIEHVMVKVDMFVFRHDVQEDSYCSINIEGNGFLICCYDCITQ